jgi:hypothetical protein
VTLHLGEACPLLESGPFRERDQIPRFFDGLREGWRPSSIVVVVREIEAAGDKVLASVEWRAVGSGSGLETSSEWVTVYTIRGRQVMRP